VRVARQPRRLDRLLADRDRLGDPALGLEGIALGQHERDEQPPLADGPGDRDPPVRVRDGVVEALEVVLGPAEVEERLQPRGELRVRQVVDQGQRLGQVLARGRDLARGGLAQGQRRGGRGQERPVADAARCLERGAPHGQRLLEVQLVQAVHRQLDLQGRRGTARAVGQPLPGPGQPAVRVLVAALPVLDRGAPGRELDASRGGVGRQQVDRLEQGRPAAIELAGGAQGRGQRHAHLHLAFGVRAREEPQGGLEPAHGGGRRARRRGRPRGQQHGDRVLVARCRRLLDVVGALGVVGAADGERGRGPGVRRQAPAAS
jgi:hypothetical protein